MVNQREVYKCAICGNIVEVIHASGGTLVCCGENMTLMKENSVEASKEKHIPVIRGNVVAVGSIVHPMEDAHYIEWIEATSEDDEVEKIFLQPCDEPEAEFHFNVKSARAYCNLHGLWKSA